MRKQSRFKKTLAMILAAALTVQSPGLTLAEDVVNVEVQPEVTPVAEQQSEAPAQPAAETAPAAQGETAPAAETASVAQGETAPAATAEKDASAEVKTEDSQAAAGTAQEAAAADETGKEETAKDEAGKEDGDSSEETDKSNVSDEEKQEEASAEETAKAEETDQKETGEEAAKGEAVEEAKSEEQAAEAEDAEKKASEENAEEKKDEEEPEEEAEEEAAAVYATSFELNGPLTVKAAVSETALLPEDTVLHVDAVLDQARSDSWKALAKQAMTTDAEAVLFGQAYDIYFTSESAGGIVTPANGEAVSFTWNYTVLPEANDIPEDVENVLSKVMYIKNGQAFDAGAVINANAGKIYSATFTTADYSALVVGTTAKEIRFVEGNLPVFSGSDYTVTLSAKKDAKIPEGSTLSVRELVPGSAEYEQYLAAASAALGVSDKPTEGRFFDITIIGPDGKEVDPAANVTVDIRYPQKLEDVSKADVKGMVHFDDNGSTDVITPQVTTRSGEVSKVGFQADSFSVFGMVYTVNFTYEGYEYVLPGEGQVLLTALFAALGIYVNVEDVANVIFSNPALVAVAQEGNDWRLTSLGSFTSEETLTVEMKNGDKYVIDVTDPPAVHYEPTINLNTLLQSAVITGPKTDESGKQILEMGVPYSVLLKFKEIAATDGENGTIFNENGMSFTMPKGFDALGDGAQFTITIADPQPDGSFVNKEIQGNSFTVSGDKLNVTFNKNDLNFRLFRESKGSKSFELQFQGSASEIVNSLEWSSTVVAEVVVTDEVDAKVTKTGSNFDAKTGTMEYTVEVEGVKGVTKNIVVTDNVPTGSLIQIDTNTIVAQPADNFSITSSNNKGFTGTVTQLMPGEKLTIKYTGKISDYSQLVGKGTKDQTKNEVSITPDNNPDNDKSSKDYENSIRYSTVSKGKATISDGKDDNHKVLTWTITVNSEKLASVGGRKIVDFIAEGSDIMSYDTEGTAGITVSATSWTSSQTISWDDIIVNRQDGKPGWEWTIPETNNKDEYIITYQTIVDTSKIYLDTTVKNGAGYEGDDTSWGEGKVGPSPENKVGIEKTLSSMTATDMTWSIELTVPKNGLSNAEIVESVPKWIDSTHNYIDPLDITSVSVQEGDLYEGESFVVNKDSTNNYDYHIVFSSLDSEYALLPSTNNSARTIHVTLKTKIDENWLVNEKNAQHQNFAKFKTNVGEPSDSDLGIPHPISISKNYEEKADYVWNAEKNANDIYLIYTFTLTLTGVSGPISISDTMGQYAKHFKLWNFKDDGQVVTSPYVYGGDSYSQNNIVAGAVLGNAEAARTYGYSISMDDSGNITITASEDKIPKTEDGKYYDVYKIEYSVRIKDDDAKKALITDAYRDADNTIQITNIASWNGKSGTVTADYTSIPLSKTYLGTEIVNGTTYAKYTIKVNEGAIDLNPEGDTYELNDSYTNLAIDFSSIDVNPNNVTYDASKNVLTFTLQDSTAYVITYRARVIGKDKESVTVENTASIPGYSKTSEEDIQVTARGIGSGDILQIRILKYDGEVGLTKGIPGVTFGVYYYNNDKPLVDTEGNPVTVTTSGTNGTAALRSSETVQLDANTHYYFKELNTPEGYYPNSDIKWEFTISGESDYSNYIYYNNDEMQIRNNPIPIKLDIPVEKIWANPDDAIEGTIVVQLQKKVEGETEFTNVPGKTLELKADTDSEKNWKGAFTDLPAKDNEGKLIEYSVKEIEISGFDSEVTGSMLKGFTIKNTKKANGSLKLKKEVSVNSVAVNDNNKALTNGTYTFTITKDGASSSSATIAIEFENGIVKSAKSGNDVLTADSSGYYEVSGLEPGTYNITETISEGAKTTLSGAAVTGTGSSYNETTKVASLVVEAGNSVTIPTATFTNNIDVGNLVIKKELIGETVSAESTKTFEFTVTKGEGANKKYYTENGTESNTETTITLTLPGDAAGKTVTNLIPGTYVVTEVGTKLTASYKVEAKGTNDTALSEKTSASATISAGESVTVNFKNSKKGSLKVDKTVTVDGKPASNDNKSKTNGTYKFYVYAAADTNKETVLDTLTLVIEDGAVKTEGTKAESILLAPGNYIVSEDTTGLAEKKISLTSDNDIAVEVKAGKTGTEAPKAAFINDYSDTCSLSVTKTLAGETAPESGSYNVEVISDVIMNITNADVTGAEANSVNLDTTKKVLKFTIASGKTVTINNLTAGSYKVEEKSGTGYTATYKLGDASTAEFVSTAPIAELSSISTDATVTIKNTYPDKGTLKVSKTVKADGKDLNDSNKTLVDGTYTFYVYETDENNDKTTKLVDTLTAVIENGVLKAEGSKTESKLLAPGIYVVSEDMTGLAEKKISLLSENDQKIEVVAGKKGAEAKTASFTNNYSDTYSLSVTKQLAGDSAPTQDTTYDVVVSSDVAMELTLTGENADVVGAVVGTPTLSNDKKTISFKVKASKETAGTVTINKLEAGTYTVTETIPNNAVYKNTYKVGNTDGNVVTLSATSISGTVVITNTYPDLGSLEVTKSVTGITGSDVPANYQVVITTNKNNKLYYVSNTDSSLVELEGATTVASVTTWPGAALFNVPTAKDSKLTVGKLELGNTYTVTEILVDAQKKIGSYVLQDSSTTTGTAELTTTQKTGSVTLTNKYEKLASLTVKKTWAGDYGKLTSAQKEAVTFTVTGPDSYSSTFTYKDMVDGSKTLTGLVPGEYTVVESNYNNVEKFSTRATYSVKDGKVTLAYNDEKTVEVTNNVTELKGGLTITKTWSGDTAALTDAYKNAIKFTITGPENYKKEILYKDFKDEKYTEADLAPGEYTVEESNTTLDNYLVTTKYKVGDKETGTVVLTKSGAAVTVNNDYNKQEASLTVKKTWTGDHNKLSAAQKEAVAFKVTGPDSYSAEFTYKDMTDGSKTLTGLVPGEYTVVESNYNNVENFSTTATYSVKDGKVTLVDGDNQTVEITNDVTELKGGLTITKNWSGDVDELTDAYKNAIKFTITGPNSYKKEILYKDFKDGKYTETDLTPGEYKVEETNTAVDNYTVTTTYKVGEKETDTVELKESGAAVTVTNNYEHKTAPLVVKKTFDGLTDKEAQKKLAITISGKGINKAAKADEDPDTLHITFADFDANGEFKVEDLPVGETYKVVEENADKLSLSYSLVTKDSTTEGEAEIVETKGATVTLTNKYEEVKKPKFEKKIMDTNDTTGVSSGWQDSADYDIGDEVYYRLTATLASNVTDYQKYHITFHDTMEPSLTYNAVTGVFVNGAKVTDYTLTSGVYSFDLTLTWGDGKTKIADEALNGAPVEVYFNAILNENAILGSQGNVNKCLLEYSSNPSVDKDGKPSEETEKTPEDFVIAFTYKVNVNKVDADGKALEGAEFKLEKKLANGSTKEFTLDTATSSKSKFSFKGLDDGIYVLTETRVPAGYKAIDPITFTVTADHKVVWDVTDDSTRTSVLTGLTGNTANGALTIVSEKKLSALVGDVENGPTIVKVSKVDTGNGKELEGATIQILDKAGKVVDEWVSTKEVHEITGLKTGEEYTLRETVAPEGYGITTDTVFVLDATGKIDSSKTTTKTSPEGTLLVEDAQTRVKVSKVDTGNGKELEGATIQILDKAGKVVDEWVSTKEVHEITGLKTGEEYTLRETVAPEGYGITTDTVFVLDATGKIDSSKTTAIVKDGVLLVEDAQTRVRVSKVDTGNGKELEGATIQILDKAGKVVDEWISTKEVHEIVGLKTGEEYTLRETVAPEGYGITTDTIFVLDETGKIDSSKTTTKTSPEGTLLVEDTQTRIKVSKVDTGNGEELEGATIQILDKEGKVVDEWISTKEVHEVTGLKTGEEYTLRETVAPEGYGITTDTIFVLDETGKIDSSKTTTKTSPEGTLLVEDTQTRIKVSKVDTGNGEELEGATIQILDKEGKVVDEWVSTKEVHEITGLKTGEEYTLRETVAPEGYGITTDTTFVLDETGKIDSSKTTTKTSPEGTLLVEDTQTRIKVSKVDTGNGEELEGAAIQILDKEGKVVEEWVSGDKAHEVTGLKTGEEYTLRETVAPEGYGITTDTTFVLDETGKIDSSKTTTKTSPEGTLLVEDTQTRIKVSKVDTGNGEELEGATIQILDKEGKVVEEWVSGDKAHEVTGLKTGEEYTLRETVAPEGYSITTDTTFVLDETGKIDSSKTTTKTSPEGTLLVEDSQTRIKVKKTDIASGEELEGATIQILDKEGNVVEEWVSTKEAHEVTGLTVGEEYTLRETVAPEGYGITTDTTFVLDENGNVDHSKTTTKTDEEGTLLIEDGKNGAVLTVSKSLRTLSGDEIYAVDQTFYVQLFYDEDCTVPASDIRPLEFKNAKTSIVTFDVEYGRDYYVAEVSQEGTVVYQGEVNETDFVVDFVEGNEIKVVEDLDGGNTVYFNNEFVRIPDNFYKEGELTVTKKVLTAVGESKKTDEIFYAGIFEDAELTKLSTVVRDPILVLDTEGEDTATASTRVQVAVNGSYTLYIAEVDEEGNPVTKDPAFKYEASYDKDSVTITEESLIGEVTITNKEKVVVTPTPTNTVTPTPGKPGAPTGDNTDMAKYLAMLALAGIVFMVIAFRRRRRV